MGFGENGREIERKDLELVLWTNLTTVREGIGFAFHDCEKNWFAFHDCEKNFGLLIIIIIIIIINLINGDVENCRSSKSFGFIYI